MNRAEARTQMMYEMERLQTDLRDHWIDESLPDGWTGLDYFYPAPRPGTRVTVRLDADMVRWFRKTFGRGYGQRINLILRVYWTAMLAGHVKAYPDDDHLPRIKREARRSLDALEKTQRELRRE